MERIFLCFFNRGTNFSNSAGFATSSVRFSRALPTVRGNFMNEGTVPPNLKWAFLLWTLFKSVSFFFSTFYLQQRSSCLGQHHKRTLGSLKRFDLVLYYLILWLFIIKKRINERLNTTKTVWTIELFVKNLESAFFWVNEKTLFCGDTKLLREKISKFQVMPAWCLIIWNRGTENLHPL